MRIQILGTEINLEPITQICGQNMVKKEELFSALKKHFSSEKYAEYEEELKESVVFEGKSIGRKYFLMYFINGREGMLSEIKITKNSLLTKYIKQYVSTYDTQIYMEQIDELLTKVFLDINQQIEADIHNIFLDYQVAEMFEIIQKTTVNATNYEYLEKLPNYDLMNIWLNLLAQYLRVEPEKTLVLIPNMDHLLSRAEYEQVVIKMMELTSDYDVTFVLGTSLERYPVIQSSLMTGLFVINDVMFQMSDMEHLANFVEGYYPYHRSFEYEEIMNSLKRIIQKIGASESIVEASDEVILKLMNQSLMIHEARKQKENALENAYLYT